MLHALVKFAEQEGLVVEPGFKTKAVRWALVFDSKGNFVSVVDMSTGEGKERRPREFERCPDLSHSEMISRGEGCRPLLVDGLDVVAQLGRDKVEESKLEFFDAKHAFWVDLLGQADEVAPELNAIAKTLADDEELERIRVALAEKKAKPTELATIGVSRTPGALPELVVTATTWHDWWRQFRANLAAVREAKATPAKATPKKAAKKATKKGAKASEKPSSTEPVVDRDPSRMLCLLSGDWTTPQATHPKLSGLARVGGHSAGDALSSFDKDAFCSYGLEQGANAAVSEQMAAVYTTALNKLIKDERRSVNLAGAAVVYWFSQTIPPEENVFEELQMGAFSSGDDDADPPDENPEPTRLERSQAESSAKALLNAIRAGERPELKSATFHALTLSGNAGRVVVRDAMEGRFEELAENVAAWFDDLEIVGRDGLGTIKAFKFNAVLASAFRELKDAPAPVAAALWRAAIGGGPIPSQFMAATLRRVTLDVVQGESPRHARYGLLKACVNRLFRTSGVPGMTTELKPVADDLQQHPAYVCGQVMGVLAKIQKAALPDVKAGVIERFYAAAMATPALVLGRLVRTAEVAHIPLIRKQPDSRSGGLAAYFQNMLTEAWHRLRDKPPTSLTLEEQTLFAIGYYHQRAVRKAKLADGSSVEIGAPDESKD